MSTTVVSRGESRTKTKPVRMACQSYKDGTRKTFPAYLYTITSTPTWWEEIHNTAHMLGRGNGVFDNTAESLVLFEQINEDRIESLQCLQRLCPMRTPDVSVDSSKSYDTYFLASSFNVAPDSSLPLVADNV